MSNSTLPNNVNIVRQPKANYTATTNPSATNDFSQGYQAGSVWVNNALDLPYVAVDTTAGAALWRPLSAPVPTYKSGDYIRSLTMTNGNTGVITSTAQIVFVPVFFPHYLTVASIAVFQVAVAAGSSPAPVARAGIYAHDFVNNAPLVSAAGKLFEQSGTIDLTSGGANVYRTAAVNLNFGPGIYGQAYAWNLPTVGVTMQSVRYIGANATAFLPEVSTVTSATAGAVGYAITGDFTGGLPTGGSLVLRAGNLASATVPALYAVVA